MVRTRMAVRRKRRSRFSWAGLTAVPWCVAAALLVSATADAGQEPVAGATRFSLTGAGAGAPADLVPSGIGGRGFALPDGDRVAADAHRAARDLAPDPADPDEIEPRAVAKRPSPPTPVDRARRGDPDVAVRPTFAAGLGAPGSLAALRAAAAAFRDDGDAQASFAPGPVDAPWADPSVLVPLPREPAATTRRSRAPNSPQADAGSTTPEVKDGATPAVARAVTLASSTPAEDTPIEIAALPKFSRGPAGLVTDGRPVVGIGLRHPDYGAAIETARSAPEQRCLAQAVYFEARSEPEEGQAAVAQVVLNRAMSGLYPGSVCGVVFQNQQRRNACQFSFACEGHALQVLENDAWSRAVRIAREVTEGSTYVSDIGGSTHYHANYASPSWARTLTRTEVIGHHVFYTLKPRPS